MKKQDLIDSLGRVQDDLVNELYDATKNKVQKPFYKRYWRSVASLAAGAAAAVTIVGAGPNIFSSTIASDKDVASVFASGDTWLIIGGAIILVSAVIAVIFYKKDK